METVNIKPKKWGNSLGLILPKQVVLEANIAEDREIEILILKKGNVLKKSFGMLKGKTMESSQKMKKRFREHDRSVLLR